MALGNSSDVPTLDDREELADWLADAGHNGQSVVTRLRSSDRVIARVTDGIYRQPASALREVISNAWDADANEVEILTDAPRFSRIYIRDDGIGMSHETLSRLLHSIGGSSKRTAEGGELGVTAVDDADLSPGGRPLIGKIGIGLFSVSQLSRNFRIITKMAGQDYRLVAEVHLRAYSEDPDEDAEREADDDFVSGRVLLTREPVTDVDAHGTDIILDNIKPAARDELRSASRWEAVEAKLHAAAEGDIETAVNIRTEPPRYHSGWIRSLAVDSEPSDLLTAPPRLPWDQSTPAAERMSRLVTAVEAEFSRTVRPDLASTLDYYLQTLWTLALSSPVAYVDSHPFDLTSESSVRLFWLSNQNRGQAVELPLESGRTVRQAVREHASGHPQLTDGLPTEAGKFEVTIDGVVLRRPIRFAFRRTEQRGLDRPMLFVGKYEPALENVAAERRGGLLALEAYLFWNGRVVPKENNGVLVRIRGSSGATFDDRFMGYQVAEQTRLRQITSEIFIQRGLDAALNIDRESFNYSHPHYQLVSLWLHRAIRQLTNRHKEFAQRVRAERKGDETAAAMDAVANYATKVWESARGDEEPPTVVVADDDQTASEAREAGLVALDRKGVDGLGGVPSSARSHADSLAAALLKILMAFDLVSDRSHAERNEIVGAILKLFTDAEES